LTSEVWETQNQTWLELNRQLQDGWFERDPMQFFEWVKYRSHLSRGVSLGTMLQDESFHFVRLGTFLERADNTARLLDVKFHAIESDYHGTDLRQVGQQQFDFYHWSARAAQRLGLRGVPQGLPRCDHARARGRAADSAPRHAAFAARQHARADGQPAPGGAPGDEREPAQCRPVAGPAAIWAHYGIRTPACMPI
jgi:hypothetical protein